MNNFHLKNDKSLDKSLFLVYNIHTILFEFKLFEYELFKRRIIVCNDKEKPLGYYLKSADYSIKRAILFKIRSLGIDEATAVHGYILRYLADNSDRDVFQKDIEAHMDVGRSSITTVLNIMERNGYIERSSVKSDARLKKITVTEKGRDVSILLTNAICETEKNILAEISESEREMLYSLLLRIKSRAEKIGEKERKKTE